MRPTPTTASLLLGTLALASGCASGLRASDTRAACTVCAKPIPVGKGVSASVGDERRVYRCIHCALTDVRDAPAAVTIEARTPLDGLPVRLTRRAGEWASDPPSTVFLILPERADECLDVHQPFRTRDEFDRYLAAHPELAPERPSPFTIGQYEELLRAGRPR
jgi:hypothetical protein